MKKSLLFASAILTVAVIGTGIYLVAGSQSATTGSDGLPAGTRFADSPDNTGKTSTAGNRAGTPTPVFKTGLENLPFSLQGTDVDGHFTLTPDGHLAITPDVRRIFDYFLTTVGEEPLATVEARLEAYINSQLPPEAAAEARHLLDQYLDYRQALGDMEAGSSVAAGDSTDNLATLRSSLAQREALRNQYLDPQVNSAFYANESAYDHYTLDRLAIQQDGSLSAAQKTQALADLKQTLPEPLQEMNDAVSQFQSLDQLEAACRERQCSPAELHQTRASLVGEEAADRLEALDHEEANWQTQLNGWLTDRDAILADKSLAPADRQAQIDNLRNSRFPADQLTRVEALEASHDRQAAAPR